MKFRGLIYFRQLVYPKSLSPTPLRRAPPRQSLELPLLFVPLYHPPLSTPSTPAPLPNPLSPCSPCPSLILNSSCFIHLQNVENSEVDFGKKIVLNIWTLYVWIWKVFSLSLYQKRISIFPSPFCKKNIWNLITSNPETLLFRNCCIQVSLLFKCVSAGVTFNPGKYTYTCMYKAQVILCLYTSVCMRRWKSCSCMHVLGLGNPHVCVRVWHKKDPDTLA